ncbi:MAG: TldD/PmbA family protein, partial [Clostridia bacterium]|nr:TldD/PmbA family protein [Clostridia bacterium]
DVKVIDHGILRGYMHDRLSAAEMGVAPTGNARAYDYSDEPLIRMRNTCILPGTNTLDDLIAAVDDGYLLAYPANGQADATGEFMFGAGFGMEIKKGKLCRPLRGATLSGYAFDLLKSVDMLSNDLVWRSGGMCGKKTSIQTGMGGPAIKCRALIGGR